MWGQACVRSGAPIACGIIPTRVGTSITAKFGATCGEDHPHACGDKFSGIVEGNVVDGSSPRVWGQELVERYQSEKVRIIPTRVGTSKKDVYGLFGLGDHPHACGDKDISK